jgi:hypothetical protein
MFRPRHVYTEAQTMAYRDWPREGDQSHDKRVPPNRCLLPRSDAMIKYRIRLFPSSPMDTGKVPHYGVCRRIFRGAVADRRSYSNYCNLKYSLLNLKRHGLPRSVIGYCLWGMPTALQARFRSTMFCRRRHCVAHDLGHNDRDRHSTVSA